MWGKPNPLESVVETLLRTNAELTSEITRLSQIISEAKTVMPPMQSFVAEGWNENEDYEELQRQRGAQYEHAQDESIAALQGKLGDAGFLNQEITFDN
jgi:hypothetical protein